MIAITNARVFTHGDIVDNLTVLIDDQRIHEVCEGDRPIPEDCTVINGNGGLLIPGMIDVHIHGACGFDMTDGRIESILETSMACARTGCTGMLVTSLTSAFEDLIRMIECVKTVRGNEQGARILGMHIEGPYLNEKRKGMQNPLYLRHPNLDEMRSILSVAPGMIRMMTLAPELPNGLALVRMLVAEGIIASIGHSDATYEEAMEGFARGINHVTHCFNALRPIHQRDPGALVAAMELPDVTCEAIVDHVHLHPAIVRLLYRNKGRDRMVLITDAMQAMGLGDGQYLFGGHEVQVVDGVARMADGSLASSTVTMNKALQKTVECGIPLEDAIRMATQTPAEMLGLHQKGNIAPGMDADLALLDGDFNVVMTMVEGKVVYQA